MSRLWRGVGVAGVVAAVVVGQPLSASAGVLDVRFSALSFVPGTDGADLELADFDGDGALDIAAGQSGGLSVAFGTGAGAFEPAIFYSSGFSQRVSYLSVDDVDGDGSPDVTAFHDIGFDSDLAGKLQVFLNDGSGELMPGPVTTVATYRVSTYDLPHTGDFDGDGQLDVALGGLPGVVAFGDGTGLFPRVESLAVPLLSDAGDLNADGVDDLIGGVPGEPIVVVLTSNGDETFTRIDLPFDDGDFNPWPSDLDLADLDENGVLDIVAGPSGGPESFAVYLGRANGTFTAPRYVPSPNCCDNEPEIGDIDGDGHLDVLFISNLAFCSPPSSSNQGGAVFLGDGAGGFAPPQFGFPRVTGTDGNLRLGDLNGDDALDAVFDAGCGGRNPDGARVSFNETVQDQADMSVAVSGPAQRPAQGQATYTVTVMNNGELPASAATTVRFTPASAFRITSTAPPTSGGGSSVVFRSGVIQPGDQVTYTVTGKVRAASGSFTAVALVDSSRYDPAVPNNTAQTRTRVVG